jgi:hypothetical protein
VYAPGSPNDQAACLSREGNVHVGPLRNVLGFVDSQVIVYTVLALIPNLLLILWAMARLSRDVRLLKSKMAMVENDINLLDQSISSLTSEFQAIRKGEDRPTAGRAK